MVIQMIPKSILYVCHTQNNAKEKALEANWVLVGSGNLRADLELRLVKSISLVYNKDDMDAKKFGYLKLNRTKYLY